MSDRALLEALPTPVLKVVDGRVAFANRAAGRLAGFDAAAVVGRPVWELLSGLDAPVLERAAASGDPVQVRWHAALTAAELRARVAAAPDAGFLVTLESGVRPEREVTSLLRLATVAGGLDESRGRAEAMALVGRAVAADAVALFELKGGFLEPGASSGATPAALAAMEALAEAARKEGADALAAGAGEGPERLQFALDRAGVAHALAVPLPGAGDASGFLVAARALGPAFDAEERSVLGAFGASLAAGIASARVYRESSRQVQDLQRLFELGRAVAGERDLPRVFRLAARTAAALVGAHEAFLFAVGDGPELHLRACLHEGGDPPPAGTAAAQDAHALLARAREIALSSLRQRAAVAEACVLPPEAGHLAAAPLVSGDRPLGCLVAARLPEGEGPHHATFEPNDVQRLRAVADYAAVAMQSGELFAEQQRRVRELSVLNEVAAECAELGLDRLLPAVTQRICRAIGAELSALLFFEEARDELVAGAISSPRGPLPGSPGRVHARPGLCLRALEMRQPRRGPVSEVGILELETMAKERGLAQATAVPLLVKDKAIGVVCVARAARPLSDDELRLLVAISSEIAVAVENARLFAETQRRAADLELVRNVGEVIARSLEPLHILREASFKLCEALEADAMRVYLREGNGFRSAIDFGIPAEAARKAERLSPTDPVLALALQAGEPLAATPSEMPEPTKSYSAAIGITRLAAAPLRMLGPAEPGGATDKGVLLMGRKATRAFVPSELRVIGAVASQLAVALQNAQLYERTRQSVEDLSIVTEAGRALVGAASLREALDAVANRLSRLIGVRGCLVLLVDAKEDVLRVAGSSQAFSEVAGQWVVIPLQHPESLSAQAVRERRVCYAIGDRQLPYNTLTREKFGWHPTWNHALPLIAGDQPVGAIMLMDDVRTTRMSEAELDRAVAIGQQVAFAVERARLNQALERSLVELAQAQAQLVRRERLAALGELAALVAHEVRNPLGVIFNSLGSLAKLVDLQGDARRVYDIIREESDRLNRIVGDMLDYTRPQEPRLRPGSLDRVLADALASARSSEKSRGTPVDLVEVELAVDPTLGGVPMDERLVHQAMVNLLSNAYQSMPKGGHVRVRAERAEAPGRRLARITITDDGPGIPPEFTPRLFEPFFTTKATGSGLGLAVVKRIIDGHRGDIMVRTAPGEGTAFVVDLPLDPAPEGARLA